MNEKTLTKKQKFFYMILAAAVGITAELFAGLLDLYFWQLDIFNVGSFHNYIYDLWFLHVFVAIVAGSIGYTHGPGFFKIVNFSPW